MFSGVPKSTRKPLHNESLWGYSIATGGSPEVSWRFTFKHVR